MKNGFDKLASPYRWLEYISFGRALERARYHFLPRLTDVQRILLLGDGDGRFTAALLHSAPTARAVAIDGSRAMLNALHTRCNLVGSVSRLRTLQADLSRGLPSQVALAESKGHVQQQRFDLVATHFLLDCLSTRSLERLVADVTAQTTGTARWVVSEFRIPPAGSMHWPARLVVRMLYLAFRLLTGLRANSLPDHASIMQFHGWKQRSQHLSAGGMLTSELWERATLSSLR